MIKIDRPIPSDLMNAYFEQQKGCATVEEAIEKKRECTRQIMYWYIEEIAKDGPDALIDNARYQVREAIDRKCIEALYDDMSQEERQEYRTTGAMDNRVIYMSIEEAQNLAAYTVQLHRIRLTSDPEWNAEKYAAELDAAIAEELEKHPRVKDESERTELERYITGEREYMVVPRPRGIGEMLKIKGGKRGEPSTFITGKGNDEITVKFRGAIGTTEQKITELLRIGILEQNFYGAKKDYDPWIELPGLEIMRMCGKKITPTNEKKFRSRLKKEILPSVASQSIDGKYKDGTDLHAEVGTHEYIISAKDNKVYFKVSDTYITYVNAGKRMQRQMPREAFYLQGNAWYIALKLIDQYFSDTNRNGKTNNILKVSTLLRWCEYLIPSFEAVQETDPGHWIVRIRDPFEKALNDVQAGGLFEWEYCKAQLAPATQHEIETRDYHKWTRLYITFRLIPDEPDQTERLENKAKRIEAAKETRKRTGKTSKK